MKYRVLEDFRTTHHRFRAGAEIDGSELVDELTDAQLAMLAPVDAPQVAPQAAQRSRPRTRVEEDDKPTTPEHQE